MNYSMTQGISLLFSGQRGIDHLTMLLPLLLQLFGLILAVYMDPYISRRHERIILILAVLVLCLIGQNLAEYLLAAGEPKPFIRTVVSICGYCLRPVILLGYFIYLVILGYRRLRGWEVIIPIGNVGLILGALVLDNNVGYLEQPVTFLTVAIVSSCVFFYIWLHLQFVRDHEKELKDSQRVQIMLSQIKPHFLYNTLGAIEELCDSDPQTAKEATVMFSRYLRGNMSSLSEAAVIPFEKELSHTRLYLELEQLRFEDALQVSYDVTCSDFYLPTLTLEPLVENAVRHGVRKNRDGRGRVTIATRDCGDHIEVTVTDDGPGFKAEAVQEEVESHIGLVNVRDRLAQVCNGSLRIESNPGKGTRATILLPKNEQGMK